MYVQATEVIIMNKTEPIRDLVTIKKIEKYLKETDTRDYVMFKCFLYLGLRTQDLLSLRVKDLRHKARFIFKEQKTNKTKVIEIHPELSEVLEIYTEKMDEDDPLFASQKRNEDGSLRPLSREQAFRRLQRAGQRVGVDLSGHVLRKTFCYHAHKNGTPLYVLSEVLNHSSEAVTRKYIGLNQENIREAYLSVSF